MGDAADVVGWAGSVVCVSAMGVVVVVFAVIGLIVNAGPDVVVSALLVVGSGDFAVLVVVG